MRSVRYRSAGITAAAAFTILASASALILWGYFFLALLNFPADEKGRYLYELHPLAFGVVALVPPLITALGIRMAIGLLELRPWARRSALAGASFVLLLCLSMIAFRPFETFAIPENFVSDVASFKQLAAISFLVMLLPVSVWWLFFFRLKSVKRQFQPTPPDSAFQEPN